MTAGGREGMLGLSAACISYETRSQGVCGELRLTGGIVRRVRVDQGHRRWELFPPTLSEEDDLVCRTVKHRAIISFQGEDEAAPPGQEFKIRDIGLASIVGPCKIRCCELEYPSVHPQSACHPSASITLDPNSKPHAQDPLTSVHVNQPPIRPILPTDLLQRRIPGLPIPCGIVQVDPILLFVTLFVVQGVFDLVQGDLENPIRILSTGET